MKQYYETHSMRINRSDCFPKWLFRIEVIALLIILSSCSTYHNSSDQAYDDAWDETKNEIRYKIDPNYRDKYNDAEAERYEYDQGCYDADSSNPPKSDTEMYMQGYEDCN